MLIDHSYFIGEINVPGLQHESVSANIDVFIAKYETDYLRRALGYSLWKVFDEDIQMVDPADRFKKLRDGSEFVNICGFIDVWGGFVNDDKVSPIANYIYYHWSCDNNSFTTTMGDKKGRAENSVDASPIQKQVRAWNEMYRLTRKLHDFINANIVDYPEFDERQVKPFGRTNIFNL